MKEYEAMKKKIDYLESVRIGNFVQKEWKSRDDMINNIHSLKYDYEAIQKHFEE